MNKTQSIYGENVQAQDVNPLDQIPDGSTLLMRPRSQKLFFTDDIYAIKKNNTVYLSFEDVVNILEFSIIFDENEEIASGWFIREDWNFSIDFDENTGTSRNQKFKITPTDIVIEDDIRFVRGETMEKWFGLAFDFDISNQIVDIDTPFPLPSIARNLRQNNTTFSSKNNPNLATLPRLEQEKSDFDINSLDVNIGTQYSRDTFGNASQSTSGNVLAEGEVLGHSAYLLATGDNTNNIRSIVSRFSKKSETPNLLGPLKARSYAFGDVAVTDMPLTGTTTQDVGFRFDNSPLDNTNFATTDIQGDSVPGWDVQLYRNNILVDSQQISQDGRYDFPNIQLFIGSNDFELFFFGPQGEIRSEQITVPVSQELLASQNKTYEISMTLEDTQTYNVNKGDTINQNTPHLSAKYNRLITGNSLGYIGVRSFEINGNRKYFLSSGLSSTLGTTLLDTNFAVDGDGAMAAEAIARRRVLGWDVSLSGRVNSDDYVTENTTTPEKLELSFNAQRTFDIFDKLQGNVLATSRYTENVDGTSQKSADIGISNNLFGTTISNRIFYQENELLTGLDETRISHTFSLRKNFGRFFYRLGSTFSIKPNQEFSNLIGAVNYYHNNKFSTDLTLQRQIQSKLDIARINANYTHDKVRLSPFFQVDSNEAIQAGLNVNFALGDTPNTNIPELTSRRLSGKGAVSALVYHDKNGNLKFDDADEPLPDTIVESINIRRRSPSNKDGYAVLRDLSPTRPTDIKLDIDTLPDPFMIAATEGNSIFPQAGTIHNMEFPVHLTGEIEGTVRYYNDMAIAQNAPYHNIKLLSLDNPKRDPITVKTGRDGYYVAFMLPPGDYLVVPQIKNNRFGNSTPMKISIDYDGTILKDMNITIKKGTPYVPYDVTFTQDIKDSIGNSDRYMRVKTGGKSTISKTINRLIQKRYGSDIFNGLEQFHLSKATDIDDDAYEYYKTSTETAESYHDACENMQSKNIACAIIVIGTPPTQVVAQIP